MSDRNAASGPDSSGPASEGSSADTARRLAGVREWREGIRHRPGANLAYRITVGVAGAVVLVAGIVLIPYPGPGWLIVIAGLAVLASEFEWAHRALQSVRHYYDTWSEWLGRQPRLVQGAFVLLTATVVLFTLWLLGTVGLLAGWAGYDAGWVRSPILG